MSSSAHIPAAFSQAIVLDTDFPGPSRGIYVSGGGDVSVVMYGDKAVVVFPDVPAGSVLPVICTRVTSAGTTATKMVVLW